MNIHPIFDQPSHCPDSGCWSDSAHLERLELVGGIQRLALDLFGKADFYGVRIATDNAARVTRFHDACLRERLQWDEPAPPANGTYLPRLSCGRRTPFSRH